MLSKTNQQVKPLVKPQVPMNPENSNWDKTMEERVTDLENKLLELQINIYDILRNCLDEAEREKMDNELKEAIDENKNASNNELKEAIDENKNASNNELKETIDENKNASNNE